MSNHKNNRLSMLQRTGMAISAWIARIKIGGLQGLLIQRIRTLGLGAEATRQTMEKLTRTAWSIPRLPMYFERCGLRFDDYETMYKAAVQECPDKLINGGELVATYLLVDHFWELGPHFIGMSEVIPKEPARLRHAALEKLVRAWVAEMADVRQAN